MHKTVVFLNLITADDEDESVEFAVELPFVPQLGTVLSFEGVTGVGPDDFIDIVKMRVEEVEHHFAFSGDKADGSSSSSFRVEIEATYLGKNPRSGQAIVSTLKAHSSVSEIHYPI